MSRRLSWGRYFVWPITQCNRQDGVVFALDLIWNLPAQFNTVYGQPQAYLTGACPVQYRLRSAAGVFNRGLPAVLLAGRL